MSKYRVGVDIGGTFTDIVFLGPEGRIHTNKIPSTVDSYASAITAGLQQVLSEQGLAPGDISEIRHGTTIASNAILEQKGARCGLIATKGFRDILRLRNLRLPRLYDIAWDKPPTLIDRHLSAVVDERIDTHGNVQRALDPQEAARAIRSLLEQDVEAICICLLNSFANPAHELQLKEAVAQLAPGMLCCTSYEVLPEIGEYERTSTTVVNAYVMPAVVNYLRTLREDLARAKVQAPVLLMQSNGGLTPAEAAARLPVNIIESGPAAGVVGAQALARSLGLGNVITFDMGGTTAKASLIEDGEFTRSLEYQVGGGIMMGSRLLTGGGYLLKVPAIDLAEVGAGGGSVLSIDAGGALQVGPESAGSTPGPLCYDRGGQLPTVTDAVLVLGYLNPEYLVDGALRLNGDRARAGLQEQIARPLGLGLEQAAYGAYQIAASKMMRAIKAVSTERGRDPRDFALFAFGGNGPVFAAEMAEALGVRRVVIPPFPGLFSSFGLLYADVEHHYSRTFRRLLRDIDPAELEQAWGEMAQQALAQMQAEGFSAAQVGIRRSAALHYQSQSFELVIPVPDGTLDAKAIADVIEAFGQQHEKTYGHRAGSEEPVECVNIRLVATAVPDGSRVSGPLVSARPEATRPPDRRAYFGPQRGWAQTPVLRRADLKDAQAGPCIIEEYSATCVVPPGATARADDRGSILIEIGTAGRAARQP